MRGAHNQSLHATPVGRRSSAFADRASGPSCVSSGVRHLVVMSIKRVILFGVLAVVLIFVLVGLYFFTYTDDDPPTLASKASDIAILIAAWPVFALTAKLPGGWLTDTQAYSLMLFMLIPTGLFWGVLIEFIRTKIARKDA